MRPKKKVLLVDHNEERLAIRRFLLTNKGFKVLSAATPEQARAEHTSCDLVVGAWPSSQSLVELARHYHVPSILLIDLTKNVKPGIESPFRMGFTQVLTGENTAPWCIVEAVKAMSARKRGPKPVVNVERSVAVA